MKIKDHIKTVQIIFFSLLTGQITFILIAVYLVESNFVTTNEDLFLILFIIDLVIITPTIVIGPMLYRGFMNKAVSLPLTDKINLYRQGVIIKLAFVEAPTIFSIISYTLSGSFVFLIIAIAILFLFYLHKPSVEKFSEDFNVSISELN